MGGLPTYTMTLLVGFYIYAFCLTDSLLSVKFLFHGVFHIISPFLELFLDNLCTLLVKHCLVVESSHHVLGCARRP